MISGEDRSGRAQGCVRQRQDPQPAGRRLRRSGQRPRLQLRRTRGLKGPAFLILFVHRSPRKGTKPEAIIEHVTKGWHLFVGVRSGLRFRERYRLRYSRRRSGFDLARVLYVVVGMTLLVASALFGWLPVLGWGAVVLGLSMIAGEFYPLARLMDHLEVRGRWLFGPLVRILRRLPARARLAISLVIAVSTFALVYGLYSLTFGG